MNETTRRSFLQKSGLLAGLAMISPKDLIKDLDKLSKHVSKHGQSIYAQEIVEFFKCKVIDLDSLPFPNQSFKIPYFNNYKACKHVTYSIKKAWPQERIIEGSLRPAMMALKRDMENERSHGRKILPTIVFKRGFDIKSGLEMHTIIYYLI